MNACTLISGTFINKYISELNKIIKNTKGDISEKYLELVSNLFSDLNPTDADLQEFIDKHSLTLLKLLINKHPEIKNFIESPEKIRTLLLSKSSPDMEIVFNRSKTEKIEYTPEEEAENEALLDAFLLKYFPLASDTRLYFELKFKLLLINNMFFFESGNIFKLNLSVKDIDSGVKLLLNNTLELVDKFISTYYPELYTTFSTRLTTVNKVKFLKEQFENKAILPLSRQEMILMPTSNSPKIQGYASLVSLLNFDDLIGLTFKDAIDISYQNNYNIQDKVKYKLLLGNKNATTWNDEDVDPTAEIGSLIQLYLESLNHYIGNEKSPLKITFGEIKNAIGSIKSLFNTETVISTLATKDIETNANFKTVYGGDLTSIIAQMKGKKYSEALALVKEDTMLYSPVFFAILNNDRNTLFSKQPQIKKTIHSIYENIFNPNNPYSLLNAYVNSPNSDLIPNIYSYFCGLFVNVENTPFMEYKEVDTDEIEAVNLSRNNLDKALKNQMYLWQAKYDKRIPQKFNTFEIESDPNNKTHITLKLKNSDIRILLTGYDDEIKITINEQVITPSLKEFLTEVFDFEVTDELVSLFQTLGHPRGEDLVKIAGSIIYNYYIGKTVNAKNSVEYEQVKDYYNGTGEIKPVKDTFLPTLIPRKLYLAITDLIEANNIIKGYVSDTVDSDGEKKQISRFGLSSLAGKYKEQVERVLKSGFDVLRNFSIYKLFKGIEFIRDYNGTEEKKLGIRFSLGEFFTGSFLYDYYDGIAEVNEEVKTNKDKTKKETKQVQEISDTSKKNHFFRIMGPVVSDKSKLLRILTSPLDIVDGKYLKDLTIEEIRAKQHQEFGQYYKGVHDNIIVQFEKLNLAEIRVPIKSSNVYTSNIDVSEGENIVIALTPEEFELAQNQGKIVVTNNPNLIGRCNMQTALPLSQLLQLTPVFDYDDDFTILNLYAKFHNVSAFSLLHEAIYNIQQKQIQSTGTFDIKIVDGVSYISEKGELHNNPSLFHQMSINGVLDDDLKLRFKIWDKLKFGKELLLESPEEERVRHNLQLTAELLKGQISINLSRKSKGIELAKKKNAGWVKGDFLILAKLSTGKRTKNLTDLNSFVNSKEYIDLQTLFNNIIPEIYDIRSPKFDLKATLDLMARRHWYRTLTTSDLIDTVLNNESIKKLLESITTNTVTTYLLNKHWKEGTIKKHTSDPNLLNRRKLDVLIDSAIKGERNLIIPEEILHERFLEVISIELNPEIEKYNDLNIWLGESYNLTTVGSFISHPGNKKASSIWNYEDSQNGQQIKREVSQTAEKHREMQNGLFGIGKTIKAFVIDDDRDSSMTFKDKYKSSNIKTLDGATLYSMTLNVLSNNSLGADAMGQTKKPFAHDIDPETGVATILKTAGFVVTNQLIKDGGPRYAIANRRMLGTIKWSWLANKYPELRDLSSFLKGIPEKCYYYNPNTNLFVERSKIIFNGNTVTFTDTDVASGTIINDEKPVVINSNYDLWRLFGGAYSVHYGEDGNFITENDTSSTDMLLKVMNESVIRRGNALIRTQTNTILPLKEASIDLCITAGAMKFGIVNLNSNSFWDEDYDSATWTEFNTFDLGEQLDSEHSAEGHNVSLMTLVINALGSRGYSYAEAKECYEALENVILSTFPDGFEGLRRATTEYDSDKNIVRLASKNDLKLFAYNIALKALLNMSLTDGNLITAISLSVKSLNSTSLDNARGKFAMGDIRIFGKLLSKLASIIEKTVRLKINGGLFIMHPSNRFMTKIGDGLYGRTVPSEPKLTELPDVIFGHTYLVNGEIIYLDDYNNNFKKLQQAARLNLPIYEIFKNIDGTPILNDLATAKITITDKNSGVRHSFMECDVVREIHNFENNTFTNPETEFEVLWNTGGDIINNEKAYEYAKALKLIRLNPETQLVEIDRNVDLYKYLLRYLQTSFNAVGSGIGNVIFIDGLKIQIDKSKTKVDSYEAILPMIYKTEFGLRPGDLVNTILNDELFFLKRYTESIVPKIPDVLFDLELRTILKNSIYLKHSRPFGSTKVDCEFSMRDNKLYRMVKGKELYSVPYTIKDGKINIDFQVYEYNGTEIIVTNNFAYFLDQFEYNDILFGKINREDILQKTVKSLSESDNEVAQHITQSLINLVKLRVARHKKWLEQRDPQGNILIENGLSDLLLTTDVDTIDINYLLHNKAGINELSHSDLIDKQARTEKLRAFLKDCGTQNVLTLKLKYPEFTHIINKAILLHVSFKISLNQIVSRTPAQCHQSFMNMKCVAFSLEENNAIYVSRMLLLLQGSDYDIDKDNVLGYEFQNGIFITWSPYYSLHTYELARVSEKLPFPTGHEVLIGEMKERAFDVNQKVYIVQEVEQGFTFEDNNNNVGNLIKIDKTRYRINASTYMLKRAALLHVPTDAIVVDESLTPITDPVLGLENGVKTLNYDYEADFQEYLDSLPESGLGKIIPIIRTVNKFTNLSERFSETKTLVDKHNMFLNKNSRKKLKALYNFIAISSKNISQDPVNTIQAQTGIDEAVDDAKANVAEDGEFNKLSAKPLGYDAGTVLAKIKSLILTLSGKQNTGIVASAMKVFEAMSLHYYQVLNEGTEEQLRRLLFDIKISGRNLKLLANSFVKNSDTILIGDLNEALNEVDNLLDSFILMSALLSLSTDNAKDPTLSKYNAGPDMIGCYTGGLILGLDLKELARIIVSDTGIILADLQNSNVFNSRQTSFNDLAKSIDFVRNGPKMYNLLNNYLVKDALTTLFKIFGLSVGNPISQKDLQDALKNNPDKLKQVLKQFRKPSLTQEDDLKESRLNSLKNDSDYRRWSKNKEGLLKQLDNAEEGSYTQQRLRKSKERYEKIAALITAYETDSNGDIVNNDVKLLKALINKLIENKSKFSSLYLNTEELKTYVDQMYDWFNIRDLIDYNVLHDIETLNKVNLEMGELRKVLALNQGLPNSVREQIAWLINFQRIFSRMVLLNLYLNATDSKFAELKAWNERLYKNGDTYMTNPIGIDLHALLYNPHYLQVVINTYEKVKTAVNIIDVMLNVAHYRGYLKALDLLIQQSVVSKIPFRELLRLSNEVLDKLLLYGGTKIEQFQRQATALIALTIASKFLSTQAPVYIPSFIILNGELHENKNEDGSLKYEWLRLGNEKNNKKFAQYVVNYLYPELKSKFPNNEFVKILGLRTYDYNLDHQSSINVSKKHSFNLQNIQENVQFNQIKTALVELNLFPNLIKYLYYYNLIAFNGLTGSSSLTDLFEDFTVYLVKNTVFEDYTKFLYDLDVSDSSLFANYEDLIRILAPTVSYYEPHNYPFMWVQDPETKEYKLCSPIKSDLSEGMEDENFVPTYTTWEGVKKKMGITEANIPQIPTSKGIYFKNYGIATDINTEDYVKSDNPLSLVSKNREEIVVAVNGNLLTLALFITLAINNGWTELECLDMFLYKPVYTVNGLVVQLLDIDILRQGLSTRSQLKECNG